MDDLIEVGAFTGAVDRGLGERLHLETHRVRSGTQRITITDPALLLIARLLLNSTILTAAIVVATI